MYDPETGLWVEQTYRQQGGGVFGALDVMNQFRSRKLAEESANRRAMQDRALQVQLENQEREQRNNELFQQYAKANPNADFSELSRRAMGMGVDLPNTAFTADARMRSAEMADANAKARLAAQQEQAEAKMAMEQQKLEFAKEKQAQEIAIKQQKQALAVKKFSMESGLIPIKANLMNATASLRSAQAANIPLANQQALTRVVASSAAALVNAKVRATTIEDPDEKAAIMADIQATEDEINQLRNGILAVPGTSTTPTVTPKPSGGSLTKNPTSGNLVFNP